MTLEDVDNLRCYISGYVSLGLDGGGAQMRSNDDVIVFEEDTLGGRLFGEDVNGGAGDSFFLYCLDECLFVDQATSGAVNNADVRLDQSEFFDSD